MNLKRLPIEFDAKAVKDDGTFEGYASTFGNVDQGYDVVMPGAFTKSLAMRPASRIKMLWQHDTSQPIGVWKEASEDSTGLHVKGAILKDVQRGAEAYSLMKAGVIDSMSIGFKTMEAEFANSGVRQIKELGLYEISLVTFPMNEQATISTVKDFDPRELEVGLREAGLSRSDAVKAVAIFRKTLREAEDTTDHNPRDAGDGGEAAIMASIQRLTSSLRA